MQEKAETSGVKEYSAPNSCSKLARTAFNLAVSVLFSIKEAIFFLLSVKIINTMRLCRETGPHRFIAADGAQGLWGLLLNFIILWSVAKGKEIGKKCFENVQSYMPISQVWEIGQKKRGCHRGSSVVF